MTSPNTIIADLSAELEEVKKQLAENVADSIRMQFLRENTGINWKLVDLFCFGNGDALLDNIIEEIYKGIGK